MLYDVRLRLHYDYEAPVSGGRHLIRVTPRTLPGVQRVIAASERFAPLPVERSGSVDFFGNNVIAILYRAPHEHFELTMSARVNVERGEPTFDVSPGIEGLRRELASTLVLGPESPHHFTAASPRVTPSGPITRFAADCLARSGTVREAAMQLCLAINDAFTYDAEATDVGTAPEWAFENRRGVCQDFAHVMIAGLRGLGIPAGYVSGFLRTLPPRGQPRLEGADAMHAWVRVWCGVEAGWVEFDPTNAMPAGADHITIGYGRDYSDVTPIVGVLKTVGGHNTSQSVDVSEVA